MEAGRICHADFFAMFGFPFRYGSGWSREDDERAERVVVIDDELNQRLFGGEDSVGRTVRLNDLDFRVVGVLAPFRPPVRYFDLTFGGPTQPLERLYLSMSHVLPMKIWTHGRSGGGSWAGKQRIELEEWLLSDWCFLQMWVELPGPAEALAYKGFLDAYTLEQRRVGRFLRPLDNRVTPLRQYMKERQCPPPEAAAMMITADLFLLACAVSLMGLLLSKFLARSAEVGVRRALGARRWDIFLQHVIECEVVALFGGLLGLAFAAASLTLVNAWFETHSWGRRDDIFPLFGEIRAGIFTPLHVAVPGDPGPGSGPRPGVLELDLQS